MDYNKMLKDAIRDVCNTSATVDGVVAQGYLDEIVSSIKQAMNDNMVVFYEP